MDESPRDAGLTISVAWGYGFGFLLMLFLILILVPEADGPSPWDAIAFRAAILELAANFRILDELADLGIVRVADVGSGWLNVDLDLLAVSNRRFGWAPFYLAVLFMALSLMVRALRQRLLGQGLGLDTSVGGQVSSYFFGRGLNLFFPFGPGDLGTSKALIEGGASREVANAVVFYARVLEMLAILIVLAAGLIYLGWGGAVEAFLWTVFLVAGVVSLTRPLGWSRARAGWSLFRHIWISLNGNTALEAVRGLAARPALFGGLVLLSLSALLLEIAAFWSIKQAFSSPMDAYVLMKDMPFGHFAIVITVASIARIIPYTFAAFGVYELVSVVMFRVLDQGFLVGATVALLDSLLINGVTLAFFLLALWFVRRPGMLETWRAFYRLSAERATGDV